MNVEYKDFEKVDIRVGRVIAIEEFHEARHPAFKLTVDYGSEIGIKKSSAQIVDNYTSDALLGSLVLGVINLPAKQIGPFMSECLILGVSDTDGNVVLVRPDSVVHLGSKLF